MTIINKIETSSTANGRFVTVCATDESGSPILAVRAFDDVASTAVNDFVSGAIDADELMERMRADVSATACATAVNRRLAAISDKLTCDGNHMSFAGETFEQVGLDEVLEDHLVRLLKSDASDRKLRSWVRFTERLYENVDSHTRAQLVGWLTAQKWLTFDDEGRLVGYRGCQDRDGCPVSVHVGRAFVNGTLVTDDNIPNEVGSVVSMERGRVQNDPSIGCSSGLHVGTYDYACSFAPTDGWVLRVAVAPEDVVSVPTDCESQKLRCCRFQVLEKAPAATVGAWYEDPYFPCASLDGDDCPDRIELDHIPF